VTFKPKIVTKQRDKTVTASVTPRARRKAYGLCHGVTVRDVTQRDVTLKRDKSNATVVDDAPTPGGVLKGLCTTKPDQRRKHGKTLGWTGYASIVRSTQTGLVHAVYVMERFGVRRETARKVLLRLHELRVTYIASWLVIPPSRTAIPVYRYGQQPDAPGIGGKPGGWERKPMAMHNRLPELTHFVTILQALEEPISLPRLAAEVGSHHNNILRLIRHAKSIKLARIAEWERTRSGPVALWCLGAGVNAHRPSPITQREANVRYKAAKRARAKQMSILRALHAPDSAFGLGGAA
jgi:hypothetical protein